MINIIFARMGMLWATFMGDPKIYFSIIGEWLFIVLFFILSKKKEDVADVYAAGVTLGFIGFEMLPFYDINFADTTVRLSFGLMLYGFMLIVFAASKHVPDPVARVLGMPSAISLPTMLVVLYFESRVPIDGLTVTIIATPILVFELVKIVRQRAGAGF